MDFCSFLDLKKGKKYLFAVLLSCIFNMDVIEGRKKVVEGKSKFLVFELENKNCSF